MNDWPQARRELSQEGAIGFAVARQGGAQQISQFFLAMTHVAFYSIRRSGSIVTACHKKF
jgi:hypothetical protein